MDTKNDWVSTLFRPPDLVGGVMFYRDSYILFYRQLPSELAEPNLTKTGDMSGSECDLKMHVQNLGYPLPFC